VYKLSVPETTHVPFPTRYFEAGLDYLDSASDVQTHGATLSEKAHSIAEQDEQAKCGSLKTTKATEQVRREYGHRPPNKATTSGNFPRRAGNGGAQRSRSGA
jgi:hypothetical protein